MTLTREDFDKRLAKPEMTTVDVTAWATKARLRKLSLRQAQDWVNALTDQDGATAMAVIVAHSLVDENGAVLFNRDSEQDMLALEQTDKDAVKEICEHAIEYNGLRDDGDDPKKPKKKS